jgi:uncharacterized protein (DUF1800 family)
MTMEASIATNRFGLGARPGDIAAVRSNPKAWLLAQLNNPRAGMVTGAALPTGAQAFRSFLDYAQTRQAERRMKASPVPDGNAGRIEPQDVSRALNLAARAMGSEIDIRMTTALNTSTPFLERWVLFWSNALTMAAKNLQTNLFPGPYEREAIRPNVLGKFSDLLKASALHQGMLVYLDQIRSFGPNSPAALAMENRRPDRNLGLNENLAREILELHTVGSDGGYSQTDVLEFARALTGWTILGPRSGRLPPGQEIGNVVFQASMHEPGSRTIMGQAFPDRGGDQARDILDWLARRPQTALRIARAVAVHFVSDTPPDSLVARLEQVFLSTDGDLKALAQALVNSPEAWTPNLQKFKTPNEFLLSTLRASNTRSVSVPALRTTFEQLGQAPWRAPSPKGWPDTADKWASPDAILKRADWSNLAAEVIMATMSPLSFAEGALGESLTPATRIAISRAQDSRQGIVLALMSSEFQRR